MNVNKMRPAALLLTGIALSGALFTVAAVAGPPKSGKKAAAKKDAKKDAKPDPAQIAAGKKVYEANNCGGCHKIGETGGVAGPELSKVGASPKHTAKWLTEAVIHPKSSAMPPYDDKIKGKDLTALVAYLGSLKK